MPLRTVQSSFRFGPPSGSCGDPRGQICREPGTPLFPFRSQRRCRVGTRSHSQGIHDSPTSVPRPPVGAHAPPFAHHGRCSGCHAVFDPRGLHRAACTRSGRIRKRAVLRGAPALCGLMEGDSRLSRVTDLFCAESATRFLILSLCQKKIVKVPRNSLRLLTTSVSESVVKQHPQWHVVQRLLTRRQLHRPLQSPAHSHFAQQSLRFLWYGKVIDAAHRPS